MDIKTVRSWRSRFARQRRRSLASLEDAARSGRPPRVPLDVRCEVVKLACDRPKEHVPFRDVWDRASLVTALWMQTGWKLSKSEIGRILEDAELRPHRIRVGTGKVFGQCRKRRTAKDLAAFMEQVARRYPTGDVYIVWDNLNIHCGEPWTRFSARHGGRFHFRHTPKHASWMNQVEVWFSVLHRRVLKHGDFADVDEMLRAILGFIGHWNRVEAHPFSWTFRGRFTHHRRAA